MSYFPTQTDIEMLRQRQKKLFTKIELLDDDFKVVDCLDGVVQSGSLSIDASSDIRKTFNASFYIKDKSFTGAPETKFWMNKKVRVYIGITEQRTKELHWYAQGLYVIQQNGFAFDAATQTVSVQCVDLTAMYNNTLAGQLTGQKTMLLAYDPDTFEPTNTKIRDSIIAVLKLAGIKKYNVEYKDALLPYNLEYGAGVTFWQILVELRDLYYPYEMFFDGDTFICRKIPSGQNEPIMLNNQVIGELVISENTTVDYSTVRNCVEVFGKTIEADYYIEDSKFDGTTYILKSKDMKVRDRRQFSFIAKGANPANSKLKIINTVPDKDKPGEFKDEVYGPFNICEYNLSANKTVNIAADTIMPNKYYVVEYDVDGYWKFVGQVMTHAMIKLVDNMPTAEEIKQDKIAENCDNLQYAVSRDPADTIASDEDPNIFKNSSPYSIDRIGRRNLVIQDDAIYTDELAMARAEYELWKSARLTDGISLSTILIPWLEPNKKISYRTKYNNARQDTEYMIQNIQMNLNEYSMTMTMNKYYPFYPEIVKEV